MPIDNNANYLNFLKQLQAQSQPQHPPGLPGAAPQGPMPGSPPPGAMPPVAPPMGAGAPPPGAIGKPPMPPPGAMANQSALHNIAMGGRGMKPGMKQPMKPPMK